MPVLDTLSNLGTVIMTIADYIVYLLIGGLISVCILFFFHTAYFAIIVGAGIFCLLWNGLVYIISLILNIVVQFVGGTIISLLTAVVQGLALFIDKIQVIIIQALSGNWGNPLWKPPEYIVYLSTMIPAYNEYISLLYMNPKEFFIYPHNIVGDLKPPKRDVINYILDFFAALFPGLPPVASIMPMMGMSVFTKAEKTMSNMGKLLTTLLGGVVFYALAFVLFIGDWATMLLIFLELIQYTNPELSGQIGALTITILAIALASIMYRRRDKKK